MHKKYIKLGVVLIVALMAYLGSIANYQWSNSNAYHGPQEVNFFRGNSIELPLTDNGYFMASGNCDGCHGYDETAHANVDGEGNDISPITMWRGGMMANAAKDPLWKAKVSHEVTVNPAHKVALEDKCTTCHAPMGKYSHEEFSLGAYGMDDLTTDSLGLDGVSCLACHKQSTEDLGILNSGRMNFTSASVAYGPFGKPLEPPMQDLVGLLPVASNHIKDAGICAGCHTLLTNSVDLAGELTGQTFVEQATYHEWLNSSYNDDQPNATTCQGCHMPEADVPVILSSNYSELFARTPYAKHELVGANSFMLKLMDQNAQSIGLAASHEVMDSTVARTERMLQQQTLDLDLTFSNFMNDTGYFQVAFENLSGHKFPSGYPSRRAIVEFLVLKENGDTLFSSGLMDELGYVIDEDASFEPHYDIIRQEDEVQIYEMVMGNVNGDVTTVLEQAYEPLKDNRLTPLGFTESHFAYDTTSIVGYAKVDPNFNFEGFEGSGTDLVNYHVPLNNYNGTIKVITKMYYQSVPPKYLEDMFSYSTPEIDEFKAMYLNADKTPVLVACDSIVNISVVTGVESQSIADIGIYPNPTNDGWIKLRGIESGKIDQIQVFDVRGKLVASFSNASANGIQLPEEAGVYLVKAEGEFGEEVLRVVRR